MKELIDFTYFTCPLTTIEQGLAGTEAKPLFRWRRARVEYTQVRARDEERRFHRKWEEEEL